MTATEDIVSPSDPIYTIIDYGDTYIQPILQSLIKDLSTTNTTIPIESISSLPTPTSKCLIWSQYESLPFDHASSHSESTLINSYVFRKALIRKHYLATVVRNWLTKYPSSLLGKHVKPAVDFEVDYAEFLDEALVECFELTEAMGKNEEVEREERQWWILKAGMGERGQGIKLFSTMEELTEIFEGWDPDSDDEGDEAVLEGDEEKTEGGIVTSQMRHFVAQPYIDPPLLLNAPFESSGRKFHIRTYVVAVGAIKVYVYRRMLALFAGEPYQRPADMEDPNEELSSHLTNTCLQTGEREGSVHEFWSLPVDSSDLKPEWKEEAFEQICKTTGEVFEAAARGMMMHFQPLPNAFEIYGLDFLVDASGNTWLMEVNAFPDFAQTGQDLSSLIVELMSNVVDTAVRPFFGLTDKKSSESQLVQVADVDLGRR